MKEKVLSIRAVDGARLGNDIKAKSSRLYSRNFCRND